MEKIGLSNAEWRLMNYLWENGSGTISEMEQYFSGITNWDRHVLIMMLKRMEAKGAVAYEKQGRAKQYYPIVEKAQSCIQETRDFLDRVYQGSMGLMLTTMVKQEEISSSELEELRKILNQDEKAN